MNIVQVVLTTFWTCGVLAVGAIILTGVVLVVTDLIVGTRIDHD